MLCVLSHGSFRISKQMSVHLYSGSDSLSSPSIFISNPLSLAMKFYEAFIGNTYLGGQQSVHVILWLEAYDRREGKWCFSKTQHFCSSGVINSVVSSLGNGFANFYMILIGI